MFGLEALKGDLYFNSFFGAIADAVGGFMIEPATRLFKRRTVFLFTFGVTIVASSGFIFITVPQECIDDKTDFCWQKVAQLSFAAIIRLMMQVGNGVTNLYVNEVFPSVYRGIGVGVSFMIGGMGNMLAPIVSALLESRNIFPQISFGVVGILGILVTVPAKETFGLGL